MTAATIAADSLVAGLGYTTSDVSVYLVKHMMLQRPSFPIKRIRVHGQNRAKWAYYNPLVNPQLEDRPRKPAKETAIDGSAGQKLELNPIPEAPLPAPAPAPAPATSTVVLPTHVKSLTLEVGGIRLRIELEAGGVDAVAVPR